MEKTLLILAGPPASGKGYFSDLLLKRMTNFALLSPDTAQEMYADRLGYKNIVEKQQIYERAFELFYDMMAYHMHTTQQLIVIDYPFSDKQRKRIEDMSKFYHYNIMTICFVSEFNTLYERRKKRDTSMARHPVYLTESYQYGEAVSENQRKSVLISKEAFRKKLNESNYDKFALGETIKIDTTTFSPDLDRQLQEVIEKIKKKLNPSK